MRLIRLLVVLLALVEGGWMTFDGTRALTVGDYITPRTGPRAGQLGPWQHVVRAVGIDPRSTVMKTVFVAYGLAWLCILVAFVRGAEWAWIAMMIAAAGALWYLPVGTLFSILQIAGLPWLRRTD
jgi:hypothetical protein